MPSTHTSTIARRVAAHSDISYSEALRRVRAARAAGALPDRLDGSGIDAAVDIVCNQGTPQAAQSGGGSRHVASAVALDALTRHALALGAVADRTRLHTRLIADAVAAGWAVTVVTPDPDSPIRDALETYSRPELPVGDVNLDELEPLAGLDAAAASQLICGEILRFDDMYWQLTNERIVSAACTLLDGLGQLRADVLADLLDAPSPSRYLRRLCEAVDADHTSVAGLDQLVTLLRDHEPSRKGIAAGLRTTIAAGTHPRSQRRGVDPAPLMFAAVAEPDERTRRTLAAAVCAQAVATTGRRLLIVDDLVALGCSARPSLARGRMHSTAVVIGIDEAAFLDERELPPLVQNTAVKVIYSQRLPGSRQRIIDTTGVFPDAPAGQAWLVQAHEPEPRLVAL